MSSRDTRPISWVKAAQKSFRKFPDGAQDKIMEALTVAAEGGKADIAKPMTGLGTGVMEVALKWRTDAYRMVYVLQLDTDIWVVHAFQKKGPRGVKTAQKDIEVIRERLQRLRKELLQ